MFLARRGGRFSMRGFRFWKWFLLVATVLAGVWLWRKEMARVRAPGPSVVSSVEKPNVKPIQPSPTSRFFWLTGSAQTYELHVERRLKLTGRGSNAQSDSFQLTVDAAMFTKVLRSDGATVSLFGRLSEMRLSMDGDKNAQTELVQALDRPFLLICEPDGKLRALRFHRSVGTVPRGFVKALLASVQFVRSETQSATWRTQELDATGEYEALYERASDGKTVGKKRERYLHARSAQGLLPVGQLGQVSGALTMSYVLGEGNDEAARLVSASGSDSVKIDPGPDLPLVSSDCSVRLTRKTVGVLEPLGDEMAMAASDEYALSAMASMDVSDSDRREDERKLKGASFSDLLRLLQGVSPTDDGSERAELQTRFSSLFRLQADAAEQAASAIAQGLDARAAKTLLGALQGAQTEKAQAALVDVFKNQKLALDLREHAVAVLGLQDAPSEGTKQTLTNALREADPELRNTAALALGNAASAERQAGQLGSAEQLVDLLLERFQTAQTEEEQSAALEALGNTGDPRILPMVQTALSSERESVRVAAARALRFVVAPTVDALISQVMTQDASAEVRKAALMACSFRQIAAFFPSLKRTVLGDQVSAVRHDALGLLGKMKDQPEVREVILTVAEKDTDPQLRQAARALL
jgi:HEAT repeat protein